ncbi:MAG: IclR family transcriptional regulator [Micrococcus sp.]|nr:IclR family transcriptional regulator [Micrococcus sp.]
MQKNIPLRQKPKYPVESVDHALALMEMVRDYGRVRLSVAARLLGVSVSTAHRLMAMLVYRGYAVQDHARRYVPGPAMGQPPAGVAWTVELRRRVHPHLEDLAQAAGETTNLLVLAGTDVRFMASVEGHRPVRVGDRQGVVLPAAGVSAGKALLAAMDPADVERAYRRRAEQDGTAFDARAHAALTTELDAVRIRGFASNDEGTEEGISAVGVAIRDGAGTAVAGLSVAVPQQRYRHALETGLADQVIRARDAIEADLVDFTVGR